MTTAITTPSRSGDTLPKEWIPASQILPELRRLTGQDPPVGIRRLLDLGASARVPIEQRNGRWGTFRENLPKIAAALGMTVLPPVAAEATRTRRSAEQVAP